MLRLAVRGVNATAAAKVIGCRPETARKYYADPAFRREAFAKVESAFAGVDSDLGNEKRTLHQKLSEAADEAFEELYGMLKNAQTAAAHKIKIAQDFLDRNPETQAGFTTRNVTLSPEQLASAARAAREMDNVIPIRPEERTA